MSELPPPERSPSGPPLGPPPARRSRTVPIVCGALISVAAVVLGPVPGLVLGDRFGLFGLVLLGPLLALVVGVVLMFFDSTRPWGIGLLIGFAAMLIIGAGACVVLLAAFSSAYGVAP